MEKYFIESISIWELNKNSTTEKYNYTLKMGLTADWDLAEERKYIPDDISFGKQVKAWKGKKAWKGEKKNKRHEIM